MLLALLAAAPASTKIAGAAWLYIVLTGLWAALFIPAESSWSQPLVQSSRFWLLVCSVAMALQAVATLYWGESWGERHVEIRLLLAAGASLILARKLRLLAQQKIWLTHSLALACCVALAVTFLNSRMTPSNAIPWAAGVSLLVCVLIPLVTQPSVAHWQRAVWGLAVLAGTGGVLLSLSRGSYGLVLWVLSAAVVAAAKSILRYRNDRKNGRLTSQVTARWLAGMTVLFGLAVTLLISFPQNYQVAADRVQMAWSEAEIANKSNISKQEAFNTSVGVRIYMWRMSLKEIASAPLLGHGSKERIAWLERLGTTSDLNAIKGLSHLHSDSLTTWFDHGLLGLSSYLMLGFGLAWLVLRRKCSSPSLRLTLLGILWMHISSGLTNMNFGHNFYGVMLALSLSLTWILASGEPSKK